MRIGVVIQARMGSTRLPGKVAKVLPNGLSILGFLIERMKLTGYEVVVATSELRSDDEVERIALRHGVKVFRGSEDDVLSRYYYAALENSFDVIVRVTADNPFTDPGCVEKTVEAVKNGADYAQGGWHYGWFPGTSCEAFSFEALKRAYESASAADEREHVTPYLKKHPDDFKTVYVHNPHHRSGCFLTVDYQEDFDAVSRAIEWGLDVKSRFEEIVRFCDENPHLMKNLSKIHEPFPGVYYNLDVNALIYTGGDPDIGFGHIMRSMKLVGYLRDMGIEDVWSGRFSERAREILKGKAKIIDEVIPSDVLIYDLTPDPYDWRIRERDLNPFEGKFKLFYNVSGIESEVEIFSKEFIPVSKDAVHPEYLPISDWVKGCRIRKGTSDIKSVLVYAGAWLENDFVERIAGMIESMGYESKIFLSPLYSEEFSKKLRKNFEVFQNVEDMCEVLDLVDAVVASYGNFAFESVSLGIPTAVYNFKDTQALLIRSVERENILVWIGPAANPDFGKLERFLKDGEIHRSLYEASKRVDFWGINRIANEIAWDINEKLLGKVRMYD